MVLLGKRMQEQLPALAKKHDPTFSGRPEWTKAIWEFFQCLSTEYQWGFNPPTPPLKGKVAGEFLTDFSLFDAQIGNRVVCESEWGDSSRVIWAFDKLREIKGDLKVLIFQCDHSVENRLPTRFEKLLVTRLANFSHHHPGHEFYLFLQFQAESARLFLWEPTSCGPYSEDQVKIEYIA